MARQPLYYWFPSTLPCKAAPLRNGQNDGQGVGRSHQSIAKSQYDAMFKNLSQSFPLRLQRSNYIACLIRGDETKLAGRQHVLLENRRD